MSAVQSRDCLTIILGILTRTLESCYRKYEVANPCILDGGENYCFINSPLCAHYSCFLGVLQHCCIFCLLSYYDCVLRQRQKGFLMLNLDFQLSF